MALKLNLQAVYIPERLADDFENIKKYPLTVIEAPSGFGKTTALTEFFVGKCFSGARILKRTFFTQSVVDCWQWLCEALSGTDRICAETLERCGVPSDENMSDIREAMGELECESDTYIILDNLLGTAEGMDMLLAALSCHCAGRLHIVASVQSVSEKNSFRIHSGGRAYYIGSEEFVFLREDLRRYFKAAGIVLTEPELTELDAITGGWIFAAYLQLMFYAKNKRFEKGILNSLIEKAFFERLTDDKRELFTRLSPFKSFTLRQAAAVSGKELGFVRKSLVRGGFIHFDEKEQQYYFHKLIYEYICGIFEQQSDDEKKQQLIRAAGWEEEHGSKINAVSLYYRAGAYEKIFAMPHTSYDLADIGDENTGKMIFDILDKTPYEVKLRYPESLVPLAFILFFINENEKLGELIEQIIGIVNKGGLEEKRKNAILGETELLISFTEFNDIAKMSSHHRRAYELLGRRASLINLKSTWTFGSPSVMCLYHSGDGALKDELELMDECMPYYYRLTGGHGAGSEIVMRAEAEFMRGNFAAADTLAHRAMFEAKSKNQSSIYQCGLFVLANTALARNDEAGLFDALFDMSESAASNTEDMCRYTQSLFLGYIYAFTHRPEKADEWLADGDIGEHRLAPMTIPFAHIIYARILLERREYVKLAAFCPFARGIAAEIPSILPQIYFYIFECCASAALGDGVQAVKALRAALAMALPDGIYMPFAQNYNAIKPALDKLKSEPGYDVICRLGAEFEAAAAQIGPGKTRLSPREREVAELIRQGFTNKQIAARLYVSVSTVKMTISNIFDKTGIRSRAQLPDAKILITEKYV